MLTLEPLVGAFVSNPIFGYSLVAALFLAVVSVTAGLARFDLAALVEPRAALACLLCVAAALLFRSLIHGGTLSDGEVSTTPLDGVERFPLVLAAMAYGPTPGLIVAALYSAFGGLGVVPVAQEGVLALELALVGWLAIYPSPRVYRWAGPANAVVAYALTWATAGLALAQWRLGEHDPSQLLAYNPPSLLGVLTTALVLFLVSPRAYRRFFPNSNIAEEEPSEQAIIEPLGESRRVRRRKLAQPHHPEGLERRRSNRRSD